jgi:hypothetical protein
MNRGSIAEGNVFVDTFKTGILSRVAHDLRLRLARLQIVFDEAGAVSANFDPQSLIVMGVMRNGKLDAASPSASDREEIQRTATQQILRTRQYPQIEFEGTANADGEGVDVSGQLRLAGQARPLAFHMHPAQRRLVASVELQPSRWNIAPYKALMGAIQLQDRIVVHFDLPDPRCA